MNSDDYSLSEQLTLTILLESWPQNSYPFLVQLPQGSILIVAGKIILHLSNPAIMHPLLVGRVSSKTYLKAPSSFLQVNFSA